MITMTEERVRELVQGYFFDTYGRMPEDFEEEKAFAKTLMPVIELILKMREPA